MGGAKWTLPMIFATGAAAFALFSRSAIGPSEICLSNAAENLQSNIQWTQFINLYQPRRCATAALEDTSFVCPRCGGLLDVAYDWTSYAASVAVRI